MLLAGEGDEGVAGCSKAALAGALSSVLSAMSSSRSASQRPSAVSLLRACSSALVVGPTCR